MYSEEFKYPSEWTESWDSYQLHKEKLIREIRIWMERYDLIVETNRLKELTDYLHENYFSCEGLKRILFNEQ